MCLDKSELSVVLCCLLSADWKLVLVPAQWPHVTLGRKEQSTHGTQMGLCRLWKHDKTVTRQLHDGSYIWAIIQTESDNPINANEEHDNDREYCLH